MTNSALKEAYNPETFREQGHQLIDQLSNHLDNSLKEKNKTTLLWKTPEEERQFWLDFLDILFSFLVNFDLFHNYQHQNFVRLYFVILIENVPKFHYHLLAYKK